jgi:hypothetical protein
MENQISGKFSDDAHPWRAETIRLPMRRDLTLVLICCQDLLPKTRNLGNSGTLYTARFSSVQSKKCQNVLGFC